ncbi:transcription mediator subunit Med12 [Phlyctema vagabunda]|uniref:Mediator of RNA polymerase II transcription subunit 12 n=1 Tax=Phlyctema vagabunda TaxID=108571 RepID=A0ABR4PA62_9HELO
MTSRPAAQRSLSGNSSNNNLNHNVLQRPVQQNRALSQQFSSASSSRRSNDSFIDLTFESPDVVQNRLGGNMQPRTGGSRLKVESTPGSRNIAASSASSPMAVLNAPPPTRPWAPLRGRPLLHTDVTTSGGGEDESLSSGSVGQVHGEALMMRHMPMPTRPGQHVPLAINKPKVASGMVVRKDARPKPYTLEVPTAAPHYSPNGHADFFPWTGNHPEDQFSEAVIRQGFFDKAQMTQNEHGSAKASIFPALKHKSGLQTLSSLFAGVLAQRRAYGQINSTSTFKPPPRVTVTDTKREIWLRDLANPTISLRRLSRSIPHGIRGKVLLEQSLSKNIPVERAVWLAKCVGANELRSFRRKGTGSAFAMSSEAKWIRDFTVCVEQFLEGIITSCAEKGFKARINYAIRLSTHFHVEYLLDREHYLDWLVSSLESTTLAKLPMWLLLVQIYWSDLLRYRKHARRLSAALLGHLAETASVEDRDLLAPLSDRLKLLLTGLVKSNPESFVSPRVWAKYHKYLDMSRDSVDELFSCSLLDIERRNRQLTIQDAESQPSIRHQLIQRLDKLFELPFTNELPMQYWRMSLDKAMLVRIVMEWSTSAHRPGAVKVFVGSRIIRTWGQLGLNVTDAVLTFIDPVAPIPGLSSQAVYHLISELARSEHFSTPIYIQWLIARGGLTEPCELGPGALYATRLLAELPIHGLSNAMLGLRKTLLHRASFDIDEEEEAVQACLNLVRRHLSEIAGSSDVDVEDTSDSPPGVAISILEASSRTVQSEIGLWLRQQVHLHTLRAAAPMAAEEWSSFTAKKAVSSITVSSFSTVRMYLECIDDFSMLADVLKIVTGSNEADVVASVADSINLHLEILAAIGAAKELFEILLTRLPSFAEDHGCLPRVLLASMSSLAARMPDQNAIAQQLARGLALSDRKTAADACSPVSDHMAGILQTEEADFTDEIEKILASGTSMDQATLERLFTKIVMRFEKSWGRSNEQQRSCGLLLTRLKTFDATQFNLLMISWVHRFQHMDKRPTMAEVLAPLISFGCLDLKDIIGAEEDKSQIGLSDPITLRVAYESLALTILPASMPEIMTAEEGYRLRVKQLHIQRNQPVQILNVIRRALQTPVVLPDLGGYFVPSTVDLLRSREARDMLQSFVIRDVESITKHLVLPLCQSSKFDAARTVESLIDSLLLAGPKIQAAHTQIIPAEAILDLANDLTLPFCQLKLASILNSDASSSELSGSQSHRLDAFEQAIETAVAAGNTTWTSIIPLLDITVAQHLRTRAERQFITLFPSPKSCTTSNRWPATNHVVQARNLLSIITATAHGDPVSDTNLATDIVNVLNNTWVLLTNPHYVDFKSSIITDWLPLLISFTVIHITAFDLSKAGHELRAKALLAIAALMLELTSPDSNQVVAHSLAEQMFDLSLHLIDLLPDDVRHQCIRSLRDTISDPRLQYIFSCVRASSDWLMLSQKDKGIPMTSGSSSSTNINGPGDFRLVQREKLSQFPLRRWEMLGVGSGLGCDNDTSLSLTLFGARKS